MYKNDKESLCNRLTISADRISVLNIESIDSSFKQL